MFSRFLFNAATRIDAAAQAASTAVLNSTYAIEAKAGLAYANDLRKQGQATLNRALKYEGLCAALVCCATADAKAAAEARRECQSANKSAIQAAARLERDYA